MGAAVEHFQPEQRPRPWRRRRGQTAVEYLLVTASLLFVFVFMYRFLNGFLAREFKAGGTIIVRMYTETPF